MKDVLPLFILPLNKEHQLRSGKGGQEVHDHTNCIYFLSSFQRVSDMTLGCLESLTCLMTLKDLHFPRADNLCAYIGDPAYPVRVHLQSPYKGNRLMPAMEAFNESMSKVRTSVEWVFGDIVRSFKFMDFKNNLKMGLSQIGKMYLVCALIQNAITCMYGNQTSNYFDLNPPTVHEFFH